MATPKRLFAYVTALPLLGLCISFAMTAEAQDAPFNLAADEVLYTGDTSQSVIEARGHVQVSAPQGHLVADKLVYDPATDIMTAEGSVVLTDPSGTTLKMDSVALKGDLKAGTLEQLKLSVPGVGQPGMPIMTAGKAERVDEDNFKLYDATYSPCAQCVDGKRPWTVHAKEMTYNQDTQKAQYKGVWLDTFGVPVMYVPYLANTLGPKKAQNGLLMPRFGKSTALGDNVTLAGYVVSPYENADYTFRTRLMSDRGAQVMVERRQVGLTQDNELRASYLNDTQTGKVRGHMKFVGEKVLGSEGRRIGINSEMSSDDTYLTQFFERNDPYLSTNLYAEDGGPEHYAAIETNYFQDLQPGADVGSTAHVLPQVAFSHWHTMDDGAEFSFNFDTLNLHRSEGIRSRRITSQAGYLKPWILDDGSRFEMGGTLRIDAYNVDGANLTTNNGTVGRVLPEATLGWEKPMLSPGGWHTITPRALLAVGPRGGNPEGIPNEDSVAYELDVGNLFEPSRFAGRDRVETGPRFIYGLDNRWGTADETNWRLFVGQSIRKFDDASLPQNGGASTNVSDWVGLVEANPIEWMGLTQRFRLDNATFTPRRVDSSLRLGLEDKTMLRVAYSFLSDGPEELNSSFETPLTYLGFNENWKLITGTQHDLADSRLLQGEAGIRYTTDCYELEFIARRRGFSNADLQPSTDYLLNIQLLTFGI